MNEGISLDLKVIYDDLKAMIRAEVEAELAWQQIAHETREGVFYSLLWNGAENVYKVTIDRVRGPQWGAFSMTAEQPYEVEVWHGGTRREAILKADELLESWANPKVEAVTE